MGARFEALCMGVVRKVSDLGCIFFVSKTLDLNNVPCLLSFWDIIRCLLFGGNASSFDLVQEESCEGEKIIKHAAQPWPYI